MNTKGVDKFNKTRQTSLSYHRHDTQALILDLFFIPELFSQKSKQIWKKNQLQQQHNWSVLAVDQISKFICQWHVDIPTTLIYQIKIIYWHQWCLFWQFKMFIRSATVTDTQICYALLRCYIISFERLGEKSVQQNWTISLRFISEDTHLWG